MASQKPFDFLGTAAVKASTSFTLATVQGAAKVSIKGTPDTGTGLDDLATWLRDENPDVAMTLPAAEGGRLTGHKKAKTFRGVDVADAVCCRGKSGKSKAEERAEAPPVEVNGTAP